jgi:hypothetical protein
MREHNRSVLGTHVVPLPIPRGRVMRSPEHFEQFGIRDDARVERYLHDLRMSGSTGTDLLVTGVRISPTAVSRHDLYDTPDLLEYRFRTPKASTPERGRFPFLIFLAYLVHLLFLLSELRRVE